MKRWPFHKKTPICKAPFAAVYFRPDGSVTPCCFNTEYVYGKYPENSINQIWNGNSIKQFRKYMLQHDLSHACNMCLLHLQTNTWASAGALQYSNFELHSKSIQFIELEFSHQCNLDCLMCFQDKALRNKEIPYHENFVQELIPYIAKAKAINFLGGEPFIIDVYYTIWEKLLQTNPDCMCIVQTNGSIWNSNIENILQRGNFNIQISLDAVEKNLYENIRRGARFDTLMQNIDRFDAIMKAQGKKLCFTVCPMQTNAHNIADIIRFVVSKNADIWFHTVKYPVTQSLITMHGDALNTLQKDLEQCLAVESNLSNQNLSALNNLLAQIKSIIRFYEISKAFTALNNNFETYTSELFTELNQYHNTEDAQTVSDKIIKICNSLPAHFPYAYGLKKEIEKKGLMQLSSEILRFDTQELASAFIRDTFGFVLSNSSH